MAMAETNPFMAMVMSRQAAGTINQSAPMRIDGWQTLSTTLNDKVDEVDEEEDKPCEDCGQRHGTSTFFLGMFNDVARNEGKFRLKLFRHTWGLQGDLYEFWKKEKTLKPKRYVGFESPLAFLSPIQLEQLNRARQEFNLEFAALIFTDLTGKLKTVDEHFNEFKHQIELALVQQPVQINSHSGMDSWSREQSIEFFTRAVAYTQTLPIPVYHETHRGRALFNPWITRDVIQAVPQLMLTADYSHWVNVCERLIDTEADILTTIASHVGHIHSRVGYEQGPQVSDPRAPEWLTHVKAHERWWKEIFEAREKVGAAFISVTPEYGPGDQFNHYMPKLPYTQQPVADVGAIVDWSAERMQLLFLKGYHPPPQQMRPSAGFNFGSLATPSATLAPSTTSTSSLTTSAATTTTSSFSFGAATTSATSSTTPNTFGSSTATVTIVGTSEPATTTTTTTTRSFGTTTPSTSL